ncbi:DUF805 domain-containing protein [Xenorhabdus sp. DI]|uniref:DUF805 domain-containing protein n=1 Tax=Xenorhabdus doucetiae TaxID=351671 RepID=UPI00198B493D|nr:MULTISPECIES: DUF805 domain-containing protein [unclassified Xenorhabdus]MBD2783199.1 DUF805 domain-containing protein [Xenorhabdus sp. 3]MBD2787952.1 DUF805 domain-containing protein [Xenorhabdus sp. DI]
MNWYLSVLKNYADFSGRARRTEYWMFSLFHSIVCVALIVLGSAIDENAGMALFAVYVILTMIPGFAVTVRRLHDTNHSGWWLLISIIPFGGIVLLAFYCIEGTKGDNDYGVDPKKNY